VKGTIYDSNGDALSGTTVTLWSKTPDSTAILPWKAVASSASDANGRFEIQADGFGNTALTARKAGYAIAVQDDLKAAKDQLGGLPNNVELSLQSESSVSGRLVGPNDLPTSGVQITGAYSNIISAASGELQTTTDADGQFQITNLPAGPATLIALPSNSAIQSMSVSAPVEGIEFKLKPSPTLDGILVSNDGTLITSATLWLERSVGPFNFETSVLAGSDGRFNFGPVSPVVSNLWLEPTPPGQFQIMSQSVDSGEPALDLDLRDGNSTTVKILVSSGKHISGLAQDIETSAPVAGVQIWTEEGRRNPLNPTVSDTDGQFTLTGVSNLVGLKIKSDGFYLFSPSPDELKDQANSDTITLVLKRKTYLRGVVLTSAGGPVPGVRLSLYNLSPVSPNPDYIPLNSNGGFQIPVAAGKVRLFAEAPGMAPVFKDIAVEGEDINDIKMVCTPGRSVSGVVLSPEGRPVPGAIVLSQLCKLGGIGFDPYYPHGNATFQMPFARVITGLDGRFQFQQAPADAGIAVKALSARYADTPAYFTASAEGDVTDAQLQFPKTTNLRGRVVDENGNGLSGADCTLFSQDDFDWRPSKTVSGTTGTFLLQKIPYTTATLILNVKSDRYEGLTKKIQLSDQVVSVTLKSLSEFGLLVRCSDLITGKPVDCKLSVSADSTPTVTPDKKKPGEYLVTNLNHANYCYLSASAEHYSPQIQNVKIISEAKLQEVDIKLKKAGLVKGRLVNSDGKPLAGTIQATSGRKDSIAHADDSGKFEFEISANRYFTAISPEGLRSEKVYALVVASGVYDVGDVVLTKNGGLKIRVIKKDDPAKDVKVNVSFMKGKTLSGVTDKNGEYQVSEVSDEPQFVELPDYGITKDIPKVFTDKPDQEITIALGTSGIKGQLLINGAPTLGLISAFKELDSEAIKTSTDKDGRFAFEDVSPGEWRVTGRLVNAYLKSKSVKIKVDDKSDAECIINIVDGQIEGSVVDEAGTPVVAARVSYSSNNQNGNTVSDESGHFLITAPAGGTVKISASKEGVGSSEPVEVDFENPSPTPVKLVIKRYTGKLVCSVLSILDGLPIENASATLTSADGKFTASSYSENYQEITIENVPPGNYQLQIGATGYAPVQRQVEISEGQILNLSEVLSPGGSIKVMIVDDKSNPASGVSVSLTPTDTSSVQPILTETTGETGVVNFASVLTGTYRLSATGHQGSVNMTVPVQGDSLAVQAMLKK